jgi:hypothetical protein
MKFGVREICDVVLKAKAAHKIGTKVFYAGEPVCYFDTLKTSSMEGAATSVYAQGGRGNARLIGWEGERTVTFTMEDALISPEGFMILTGAGLIDAKEKPVYQHVTETIDRSRIELSADKKSLYINVSELPYMPKQMGDNYAYVMLVKNGDIISEPLVPVHHPEKDNDNKKKWVPSEGVATDLTVAAPVVADAEHGYWIMVTTDKIDNNDDQVYGDLVFGDPETSDMHGDYIVNTEIATLLSQKQFDSVIVDYYVEHTGNAQQIEITADKFGGNYYLEASTLFRDQNGVDMPAEFIIPNCKVQSNFTFTMASSGDPSSFTFTMDAFPDYTRFDKSKKVLAAIQIIKKAGSQDLHRHMTDHEPSHDLLF